MSITFEEMEQMIQEWMAQALTVKDLAKIYSVIVSEADRQLEYLSEELIKEKIESLQKNGF